MKIKHVIILLCFFFISIEAQNLNELSFGDEHSLDIATWNIEWFPKNDELTIEYVIEIINIIKIIQLSIIRNTNKAFYNENSLDKFSASDYLHASSILARHSPRTWESELILRIKCPIPKVV